MNVRVVIGLEQQELVLLEAGVVLKRQDGLQGEVVWTERSLEMTFPKQVVATDLKKKLFVIPNCAQIAFILLE